MGIVAIGLNHASASEEFRGRFAIDPGEVAPVLNRVRSLLKRRDGWPEAALLSTCNRTELYCSLESADDEDLSRPALDWLADRGGVSAGNLLARGYVMHGAQVARHAFRVASGLDSMVLGEPQILGQMKRAMLGAEQAGTLGRTLHQLFQRTFSVAKEVRSTTDIGAHSVSLAAASVRLATQHFADLRDASFLLVGAGEMIQLVAAHLAQVAPRRLAIANRSAARGAALAQRCNARLMRLDELPEHLCEFDVVISCTASTLPLIGLGACERALHARKGRATLMIDLAVPRDIEPEVARLPGVSLYSIDDLGAIVQVASSKRQAAVVHAEAIIERRVQNFVGWLDKRRAVPLIRALNARIADWQSRELERARKRLARGAPVEDVLGALSRGLTNKLMHGVFSTLNHAEGAERASLAGVFERVYLHRPSGG